MRLGLWRVSIAFLLFAVILSGAPQINPVVTSTNCTLLQQPDEFRESNDVRFKRVSEWTDAIGIQLDAPMKALRPRRARTSSMTTIRPDGTGWSCSAPSANDQEFLRRVMLDLTGRIPSPEQVRAFAYDTNTGKRDFIVDALIGNGVHRKMDDVPCDCTRTMPTQRMSSDSTRAGMHSTTTCLEALTLNKPYNQIAHEIISASGDNMVNGQANWVVGELSSWARRRTHTTARLSI
jgi:hypothetical protein